VVEKAGINESISLCLVQEIDIFLQKNNLDFIYSIVKSILIKNQYELIFVPFWNKRRKEQ
jgi:hypothetical protein